jgi:hypothetical protein
MTIVELADSADTLRYRIQVRKTLSQDDVRIIVPVTALSAHADQTGFE